MKTTHRIRIDMLRKGVPPVVEAMQFDAFTRVVEVELFSNGVAWNPPDGTTFAMSYGKPDGKRGFYEMLPDGSNAISVSGNVVSATIAPQALTVAGTVFAALVMRGADTDRLSSFPFEIHVTADPSAGSTDSEDYFNPSYGAANAVLYVPQELTEEQKAQARANISVSEDIDIIEQAVAAVPKPGDPVANVYNGETLPPLLTRSGYPNACIATSASGKSRNLYLSKDPFYVAYRPDGSLMGVLYPVGKPPYLKYVLSADGNNWEYNGAETPVGTGYLVLQKPVWANTDLKKAIYLVEDTHDDTVEFTQEVAFVASEPVPVYDESGGSGDAVNAVRYTPQTLTTEQQAQARANIGAGAAFPAVDVTALALDFVGEQLQGEVPEDIAAVLEECWRAGMPCIFRFYEDSAYDTPGYFTIMANIEIEQTFLSVPTFHFTFAEMDFAFFRGVIDDEVKWIYIVTEYTPSDSADLEAIEYGYY